MRYVISYDIVNDRRRQRTSEALKDFGDRVQYSVFECELESAELEVLVGRLVEEMEPSEDSCRIYRLCGACVEAVRNLGCGKGYHEAKVVIV